MDFLKNKHRNKNITASGINTETPRTEDFLKRCQDIGIGATNYYYHPDYRRYGIDFLGTHCSTGVDGLETVAEVTPEMEKRIEEGCYKTARTWLWNNMWHFSGECEGQLNLSRI